MSGPLPDSMATRSCLSSSWPRKSIDSSWSGWASLKTLTSRFCRFSWFSGAAVSYHQLIGFFSCAESAALASWRSEHGKPGRDEFTSVAWSFPPNVCLSAVQVDPRSIRLNGISAVVPIAGRPPFSRASRIFGRRAPISVLELRHRRQRRRHEARGGNVVEAGHGDVARDVDAALAQRLHDADRHQVVGGEDRGRLVVAGQDRFRRARAADLRERVVDDDMRLDAGLGERMPDSPRCARLAGRRGRRPWRCACGRGRSGSVVTA